MNSLTKAFRKWERHTQINYEDAIRLRAICLFLDKSKNISYAEAKHYIDECKRIKAKYQDEDTDDEDL